MVKEYREGRKEGRKGRGRRGGRNTGMGGRVEERQVRRRKGREREVEGRKIGMGGRKG